MEREKQKQFKQEHVETKNPDNESLYQPSTSLKEQIDPALKYKSALTVNIRHFLIKKNLHDHKTIRRMCKQSYWTYKHFNNRFYTSYLF